MRPLKGVYVALLVPTLAAVWACSGATTGSGTGDDGGGSSSGAVNVGGPCGPQTCAGGCCDNNNTCQAGNTDISCGTGNGVCENCSSLGETCQAGACSNGSGGSSSGAGSSGAGGSSSSGGFTFPRLDGGLGGFFDAGNRNRRDAGGRGGLDASFQFDVNVPRFDGAFPTRDSGLGGD